MALLLDHSETNKDIVDDDGNTALHYIIKKKEPMAFDLILKSKPDLHVKNKKGLSPIHLALLVCPIIALDLVEEDRTVVNDLNMDQKLPGEVAREMGHRIAYFLDNTYRLQEVPTVQRIVDHS
eukprot:TRINITY_DN816_c0_g1_i28.p2 TRINITY_DN816_c0_g1~~TRINITY_DN816_c0_g1_i28.p2  ORF type:complete len:123 (-),score=27.52 TRINITY_DN816_c0_g1_i28:1374-1742(-)